MTSRDVDIRPVPVPDHIGQGTAVEQSRAVAEVLAAVQASRQFPRDPDRVLVEVMKACRIQGFAQRAFYSMPRDGSTVTGPSVHLARELARSWGNVHHGINELRQNLERGESEIQAFAWDLESNVRVQTTYVVPHVKDAKGRRKPIETIGGVYENNSNVGARRVRAAIFAVLPEWLKDAAIAECRKTLETGGGKPLETRRAEAVAAFARLGVTERQLVDKVKQPAKAWTAAIVADLGVLFGSLSKGEVTAEEAFPSRVSGADILASDPAAEHDPAEPPADDPWAGRNFDAEAGAAQ